MSTFQVYGMTTGRLVRLLLTIICLRPFLATAVDTKLDLIQTKTGMYSNVTVTTTAPDYIVIQHARGLASLKVADLPLDVQKQLGYAVKAPDAGSNASAAAAKATALVNSIPTKDLEQAWSKYAPRGTPSLQLKPGIVLAVLGVFAVMYLVFCYCGSLICQKAGKPAGFLIWVPILQFIPLFRAADMSPVWVIAMLLPVFNLVAHIVWAFKISRARGQGLLTAILLILPVTNMLAFMYLAFAATPPPAEEKPAPKKFTPMSLTFDTA